jgi:hypothetical protein
MLRRAALVKTDGSEELSAFFIGVSRIGEVGTLAVTSNRRTLRRNTVPPKCQLLQEPHGVTSQKTPFFNQLIDGFLSHLRAGRSLPSELFSGTPFC